MNHTASTSVFSTARQEDASDLRTILAQLADDLEEFCENQNMAAAEGDLPRLCMAADVLRAMVKTSEDPATTRESFFEAILDAAEITELAIEKDAQPQTLIPFFSGIEYIRPRPASMPSMPKVSPAWQQTHLLTSSPKSKSPSTTSPHRYDPANRVDRPPIPTPPRRPTPRARAGMAVAYPDGEYYWTHNAFGRTLQSEVTAIARQAAAENIPVPEIPGPRWNGRVRQFVVRVPWEGCEVWFDRDDEAGCAYERQVEVYWEGVKKYWGEYPPREGEFDFGAAAENRNVDETAGKVETRVEKEASAPKDAENRDSTAVLGKRSRGLASENNDDEDESRLDSSPPRPTKKLRSSPSLTLTIPPPPATLASPLAISPQSPLTPLPSRHSSPVVGSPVCAPAPASIPELAPAVPEPAPPACARPTPTRARGRRSAAPPPESTRRSTRTAAKKSA